MRQDDFKRAMKLPETARQELLDRMDRSAGAERESNSGRRRDQRKDARWSYRETDIAVAIEHPAGGVSRLLLFTRNLSAGGISFLHNGFLHPKSRCKVLLPRLDGQTQIMTGSIVSCRHVGGLLHEIGLKFDRRIDPAQFLRSSQSTRAGAASVPAAQINGRVLVIDDNESDRSLLLHHLKRSGVDPLSVPSSDVGDAIGNGPIDLVICELNLKGSDGVEIILALRGAGFGGPIVVLTAEIDEKRIASAREAGATRVLTKPYVPEEILSLLAELQEQATKQVAQSVLHSTMDDQPGMQELVAKYIDQVRDVSRRIDQASLENNLAEVRQLCLSLKGSATGYGFAPLGELAMAALKSLDSGQAVAAAAAQLRELCAMCARLQPRDGGGASPPADQAPKRRE